MTSANIHGDFTNDERAERGAKCLADYFEARGDGYNSDAHEPTDISDLIADLLHLAYKWSDREDKSMVVERVLRLAQLHFMAEVDEESDSAVKQETV